MTIETNDDPWVADSLSYAKIGASFTQLIKTIDHSKVISIEAGFGQGKTFFRKAWAQQLRASGEFVIEIDAQQADHTGDPVVTFLGALLSARTARGQSLSDKLTQNGLKLAGVASRGVLRALLRSSADEIIDTVAKMAKDQLPDAQVFDKAIEELGNGMSNTSSQLLASHLAIERARQMELPTQIDAIRDELTAGSAAPRIIILIDELDRCHPEYAISLLEAMKLIFHRDGFVFCLMVNPSYLEGLARHRFGAGLDDEPYLDKFIDLRLSLRADPRDKAKSTEALVSNLRLVKPFGDNKVFSVGAAANLAGQIVSASDLSFRQIKRVIDRLDLVLRIYRDHYIDLPLLVFLAFEDVAVGKNGAVKFNQDLLPRRKLSPQNADSYLVKSQIVNEVFGNRRPEGEWVRFVRDTCPELTNLEPALYGLPDLETGNTYLDWYKVLAGLGPNYVPSHQAMLNAAQEIMAY